MNSHNDFQVEVPGSQKQQEKSEGKMKFDTVIEDFGMLIEDLSLGCVPAQEESESIVILVYPHRVEQFFHFMEAAHWKLKYSPQIEIILEHWVGQRTAYCCAISVEDARAILEDWPIVNGQYLRAMDMQMEVRTNSICSANGC